MSFLRKLFGKKTPPPKPASPPSDPSKDPNMIRVFDSYGQELFITKQQWRDSVLLDHIKKVWNEPDALYSAIVQALQDGFGSDMIKASEQLAAIDPNAERGAVILAIVYREQKRLDDSEKILRRHIERHGESGVILTNLAKVHADRGNKELSLQTLWHSLELDPNQENGMGWYEVIHREQSPAAGLEALRRIAALPGSWRAQLWLARDALTKQQLEDALRIYRDALAIAPRPVPTDMLQQISGDLGNHGHLPEILQLTEPLFQISVHGIAVGNNLIKANLDLGRLDAVRALINQHYAQKRPDWKQTLSFWDTELAKLHVATVPQDTVQNISVSMLTVEGPVWLPEGSPANELFAAPIGEPVRVAFLGSTFETVKTDGKPHHQVSDTPGRLSRAIPLFLAEHVRFHGCTQVRTVVPWLLGNTPAFAVCGVPWTDDEAARHGRSGEIPCDYVVATHLKVASDPWQIELRLIRTIDSRCLANTSVSFPMAAPESAIRQLAGNLAALLGEHTAMTPEAAPPLYRVPTGQDFGAYLIRLEQLLAVRCSTIDNVPPSFLHGERDIVDGNLQLCLRHPDNAVARIVLIQTILRMKKVHPQVVEEFQDRIQRLQKEKTLSAPVQGVLQRMISEVYP